MLKKKNSLNLHILKYFLIFSILILSFLWAFQVIFLGSFYKKEKTNEIKNVAKKIVNIQNTDNFNELINDLSFDKEVCIEITDRNSLIYESTFFGKGCMRDERDKLLYKNEFINSNLDEESFEIDNNHFDSTTLFYAIKLKNDRYAFINTSINPIDSTTKILQKQLIIVTLIVLILSFILSYFISKHLSLPIIKLNKQAKNIAEGDFNHEFDDQSNILELNELSDTLNYARLELGKTEDLRRDLMANVSHDLKTPLTMIKAYAEMIQDLHADNYEKQKEDINIITSEVDRLSILVQDILDLSKMQSNIDTLNQTEFDLISLCEEILKKYKLYQEVENYKFVFKHNIDKLTIKADKKKIEQVIYNLINNAINYTGDNNTVYIDIFSTPISATIKIIDTGKGIKESDIPYIWDKYYKNKKKHKRNLIGTGLGLSIVKNILELHNYKYGVETKINKGTTFYFEIPLKK